MKKQRKNLLNGKSALRIKKMTRDEFAKLYPACDTEEYVDPIVFESPIIIQKSIFDRMLNEGIEAIPEGSGEGVLDRT